ncbi:unnamed protein product [Musa textilis]
MGTGTESESSSGGAAGRARGLALKALLLLGGALLLRRMRKSTTRWDHARAVADSLSGEKFSREQARNDPDNYFNIRMLMCPAAEMVDGSRVLYFEQAFWRTPHKPFRQCLSSLLTTVFQPILTCVKRDKLLMALNIVAEILYGEALFKRDEM